ncbi:malonyl-CoA decarboxylase [Novosphingobium chloroacetimidivorans]|uniref:Malonyl-CoA decarboxylase n=1 Tax=Novosphingobium chloroacetimidivorans TaxID=1428314 RepID=A0A7W7KAJ7_9SPHN|nr:malonyl-CoA decarboxylase [Novosphingobium chloroacetimidivorans]MBB4858628.1 malonyl-CoA decarboxylase [Novosphingobium chloroacetimidivorans]
MRRLRPLMVITPATDVNALALLKDLAHALLSVRGEASGVAIATDLLRLYEQSDEDQRRGFFAMLATDFGPDETILAAAWKRYCDDGPAALPALARSVEAPRQELFRRLNLAPGGTSALVRMRADLLVALDADASLAMVDADLSHLLQSWFNRGFLFLRSIDWSSPASLLERIIRYEAVHDIASWADLRNRLDPDDRRCYAFFHPAMPDEPLIFVEVGLTRDIPDDVRAMLDPERTPIARSEATTATFYSISNCQPGLRGISFGHFLIKQVAADLKRELPALSCFVTLSPLPGLIRWLRSTLEDQADVDLLARIVSGTALEGEEEPAARAFLLQHAVTYLTQAKNAAGKPRDPVARFHLGNGARLERLNWNADRSANGLRQSGGLMVNYLYDLARIEENHEAFAERSEIVTGAPFDRVAQSTMGSVDRART